MRWATAVKEWNSGQIFRDDMYGIPKKGGEYYDEVKAIMENSKFKRDVDSMMGKKPETTKPVVEIPKVMESKELIDFLWKTNWNAIDNLERSVQRNPTEEKIKELRDEILFILTDAKEQGINPQEVIDYLKQSNPFAMEITSTKKKKEDQKKEDQKKEDQKKEDQKKETPILPKVKPDYDIIPPEPKGNSEIDNLNRAERKRILNLLKVPEGQQREEKEIRSFASLLGNSTMARPLGKWKYEPFKSRDEALREYSKALVEFKKKYNRK